MKTPRLLTLLTLLTAALLCAASPRSSPAADVTVDISSYASRDPEVVVRQIELNVAIQQYEKVLMELHEATLQKAFGPTETGLTVEQQKQWLERAEKKQMYLEETAAKLRHRIHTYVAEARDEAERVEKTKAESTAKQSQAGPDQPTAAPRG